MKPIRQKAAVTAKKMSTCCKKSFDLKIENSFSQKGPSGGASHLLLSFASLILSLVSKGNKVIYHM